MMEIERTYGVAEISRVELRIALGDLTVAAGSGDQIGLRARLHSGDESELETTITDGILTIKNRSVNGWPLRSGNRIDVVLTVPRDAAVAVSAKTGLGDVSSDDVAGLHEVQTGKGDVRALGGSSPLAIKTGKGDVAVRQWRGDVDVTTGKGDVAISDLAGGLRMTTGAGDTSVERWQSSDKTTHQIKTGSGDVAISDAQVHGLEMTTGRGDCTLRQATLHSLRAQSGFGDFSIEGDAQSGQWEVRTGKGDLALALPATAAARIEAATRHGSVRSELPQVKAARPGPASQLGGRTIMILGGEPRADIRLETTKGDISVRTVGAAPLAVQREPANAESAWPVTVRVEQPAQPVPVAGRSPAQSTAFTVLESLSRGEISVDEAEALLKSLERG